MSAKPVKLSQKLAFAAGAFSDNIMGNALKALASPIYNVILGINPALIGIVLALPRLWEAIIDPWMGNVSDNFHSRWGRRRPFIAVGSVLCAVLFPLIWWAPRGMTPHFYFIYLLLTSAVFYTAYAVFTIPWTAMGYELSEDYNERSRIMAYRTLFASISSFSIPWLFAVTEMPIFKDPIEGVRWLAVALGVVILIFSLLPALFCREGELKRSSHQRKISLLEAWTDSFQNGPFVLLMAATGLVLIGLFTVISLGFYLNAYYVYTGDLRGASILSGFVGNAAQIAGLVAIPVLTWMASRLGKRTTLNLMLGLGFVGTLLKWPCYTPAHPYWQIIPNVAMAPGITGLWMLMNSMLADVCDYEEMRTGLRREGVLGALYNWAVKAGAAISFFISGLVLVATGFDQKLGAMQHPSAIFWMRVCFTVVPAVALLGAMGLLVFFRIDEKTSRRIRRILDRRASRRKAANPEPEGR